jgi:hypothetical protein
MSEKPLYKVNPAPAGQDWLDASERGYTTRIPPVNAPRVADIVEPGASRSIVAPYDPNSAGGGD